MDDRGGSCLATGKIGRVRCLRQHLMMPGETIRSKIQGRVDLEQLRERDNLRINASLCTFLTPVRWLWPEWPDFVKQGPDTALYPPQFASERPDIIGLGSRVQNGTVNLPLFFESAYTQIYNNWYKWPEDPDLLDGQIPLWGAPGVPLSAAWSRARYSATPDDAADYNVASATEFDVRDLAETQARFRTAMNRDVLSYGRWMELCESIWGTEGSREVEQVPMLIDSQELGVQPRDMPATDAAGQGQWQSIVDFNVDHEIRGITAPEHCVLTYMLLIRFAPIIESRNPHASDRLTWEEFVGDPEILSSKSPVSINTQDIDSTTLDVDLGYQGAAWRWHAGFDVVGERIDLRDSFPYMEGPTTQENAKDATRIKRAFKSQSLGDYKINLYFTELSKNRLGSSLESYFAGMKGQGNTAEFPRTGKML